MQSRRRKQIHKMLNDNKGKLKSGRFKMNERNKAVVSTSKSPTDSIDNIVVDVSNLENDVDEDEV